MLSSSVGCPSLEKKPRRELCLLVARVGKEACGIHVLPGIHFLNSKQGGEKIELHVYNLVPTV